MATADKWQNIENWPCFLLDINDMFIDICINNNAVPEILWNSYMPQKMLKLKIKGTPLVLFVFSEVNKIAWEKSFPVTFLNTVVSFLCSNYTGTVME